MKSPCICRIRGLTFGWGPWWLMCHCHHHYGYCHHQIIHVYCAYSIPGMVLSAFCWISWHICKVDEVTFPLDRWSPQGAEEKGWPAHILITEFDSLGWNPLTPEPHFLIWKNKDLSLKADGRRKYTKKWWPHSKLNKYQHKNTQS